MPDLDLSDQNSSPVLQMADRGKRALCEESGCGTGPQYNYPGRARGVRCKTHALSDMVNIVRVRCEQFGCERAAQYALTGAHTCVRCREHKTPEMVNIRKRTCGAEGCDAAALYRAPGIEQSSRCKAHKLAEMVRGGKPRATGLDPGGPTRDSGEDPPATAGRTGALADGGRPGPAGDEPVAAGDIGPTAPANTPETMRDAAPHMPLGGASLAVDSYTYSLVPAEHLVEAAAEGRLVVWIKNRQLDSARVDRLYAEQAERLSRGQALSLFAPTPFVAHRDGLLSGVLELLDGQHRLGVLRLLSKTHPMHLKTVKVLLCVATGISPETVFERANSGTPIPAAYYNERVSSVTSEFAERLALAFPKAASPSVRPLRPNFNKNSVVAAMSSQIPFRDSIMDGKLTAESIFALAVTANRDESAITAAGARAATPASAIKRATASGFHLGLREGWAIALALRAASDE